MSMKEIPAAVFKAQCLALMEDVRSTKRPLVITKRGKPVANWSPLMNQGRLHRQTEGCLRPRCRSAGGVGVRVLILLNTHVLFWAVGNSKSLSRPAASAIRSARRQGGIAISAISVWELASMLARGFEFSIGDATHLLPRSPLMSAASVELFMLPAHPPLRHP